MMYLKTERTKETKDHLFEKTQRRAAEYQAAPT